MLQDMLVAIFTGKSSIPDATTAASDKITHDSERQQLTQ